MCKRAHVPNTMAHIDHPNGDGQIEVEIVDSESHNGDYVQVKAVEDSIKLSDESGEPPWVEEDEVFESDDEQRESQVEAEEVQG